jgi:hypothetical protein
MRDGLDGLLPRRALVVGSNGRVRFASDGYEASGFAMVSDVRGEPDAIDLLRRESRHGLAADGAHSALTGANAQARVARIDGRLQWSIAGRLVSRGFEENDVGFQRNANWLVAAGKWKYEVFRPGQLVRRWSVGSEQLGIGWTTAGLRRAATTDLTGSLDLRSYWGGSVRLADELAAHDPEILRGGPALLLPARTRWSASVHSDSRRRWLLTATGSGSRAPATRSHDATFSPELSAFLSDPLQVGVSPSFGVVREGWQYVDQAVDAAGHRRYVLGALDQRTASVTTRATYAFSAHLTIQVYSQAFVSGGRFDRFDEVLASDRVVPIDAARVRLDGGRYIVDQGPPFSIRDPAFSAREFHFNALMRWEFLPGSTLFVVWTQERLDDEATRFDLSGDLRRLGRARPTNALVAKVSYWIAR